jgi:hypothetical protein
VELPPGYRVVEPELVQELLTAHDRYLAKSAEAADLLDRAVANYYDALRHWMEEQVLLTGEYLWMAAETLSRAHVEMEAAAADGITPKNLCRMYGKQDVKQLYELARQDVFAGHLDTLKKLNDVSDAFEHGYMNRGNLRAEVAPLLVDSARCIRHGLVKELDLAAAIEAAVLDPARDEPKGLVPEVHVLHGRIEIADASVAPERLADAIEPSWTFDAPTADPAGGPMRREVDISFGNVPDGMRAALDHVVRR